MLLPEAKQFCSDVITSKEDVISLHGKEKVVTFLKNNDWQLFIILLDTEQTTEKFLATLGNLVDLVIDDLKGKIKFGKNLGCYVTITMNNCECLLPKDTVNVVMRKVNGLK